MVYLSEQLFDQAVDRLQAVGRLERPTQLSEQAQTMQGQGLLHAFPKAGRRRLVLFLQLGQDLFQSLFGLSVGRSLVGSLQALAHGRLFAPGQVRHHVLPLVPLTTVHQGPVLEALTNRRPKTRLLPVDRFLLCLDCGSLESLENSAEVCRDHR